MATKRKRRIIPKPTEPIWDSSDKFTDDTHQLSFILNWYNYNYTSKHSRKFIHEYLDNNCTQNVSDNVKAVKDSMLPSSLGWACRIYSQNTKNSPPSVSKFINYKINQLSVLGHIVRQDKEKNKKPKSEVTIQERMEIQLSQYLAFIENLIDNFLDNNCSSNVSILKWLRQIEAKSIQAKRISEQYINLRDELRSASKGLDSQLVEGYSFLSKAELKRFVKFLEKIVYESKEYSEEAKDLRKRRTVKAKSPTEIVSKLKYQKEFDTLGLKSVPPSKIIGSTQIWTYNTKYKILTVYYSEDDSGLTVNGTTIKNINSELSRSKRLRKPDTILNGFEASGKVGLRSLMDTISTKDIKVSGRTGDHTIILKCLK